MPEQVRRETGSVRVVIADDHPVVRAGLQAMLARSPGIEVVAEAATGAEAVAIVAECHPDVVVMDLNMPVLSGAAATAEIRTLAPEVAVLVLTMEADDEHLLAALQVGARGYVLKGAEPDQLVRAIHGVANGDLVVGGIAAERLAEYLRLGRTTAAIAFPLLTARERQVLSLMATGANNPEIARRLDLRPKTVRNHVSNVLVKLQARDRSDAMLRARAAGLGHST
jgi:DNA-binding NarL/FixJ family response regulator